MKTLVTATIAFVLVSAGFALDISVSNNVDPVHPTTIVSNIAE